MIEQLDIEVTQLAAKNNKKSPNKKPKSKIRRYYGVFLILVIIAIIVVFQISQQNKDKLPEQKSDIAATVNGEIITSGELDLQYERLPTQYKAIISEENLLDQMIVVKLLLQEARNQGIEVKEWEVYREIDAIKDRELITTEEEFNTFLVGIDSDIDKLWNRLEEQLMIDKLLEETIDPNIDVTDSMVESFYERYQEEFNNVSLDEINDFVEDAVRNQLRDGAIQIYIKQLEANADIQIGGGDLIATFEETGDYLCEEGGKPIVRLFSISASSHTEWIQDVFASTVGEYVEDGRIVAYHWQLDTGDDILTEDIEKAIPKAEVEIFRKYSPEGAVPTFVFGCRYTRIGNGADNDLDSEEKEFREIIKTITK